MKKLCLLLPVVLMLAGCLTMSGGDNYAGWERKGPLIEIHFKQNSAALNDKSKNRLDDLAQTLQLGPSKIQVKGFCNETEIKNMKKDDDVCNDRANVIKAYLVEHRLKRLRVSGKRIEILPYDVKREKVRGTFAIIYTWLK
jgi:hypothetical protein